MGLAPRRTPCSRTARASSAGDGASGGLASGGQVTTATFIQSAGAAPSILNQDEIDSLPVSLADISLTTIPGIRAIIDWRWSPRRPMLRSSSIGWSG